MAYLHLTLMWETMVTVSGELNPLERRRMGVFAPLSLFHRSRRSRRSVAHALRAFLYSPGGPSGQPVTAALRWSLSENRAIPPEKYGVVGCAIWHNPHSERLCC